MERWAVPSPATGMMWTPPRCANGVCTYGIPTSDPSLNTVSGIAASGLTSGDFFVDDSTQIGATTNGVTGNVVTATWADFDNDGARPERGQLSPVDAARCFHKRARRHRHPRLGATSTVMALRMPPSTCH